MNTILLKKYETIDQSKVTEKDKRVLEQLKKLTNNFEETDEAKNKVAEKILDQVVTLNPDAVKKPQVVAQKVAKVQKVAKAKRVVKAKKPATTSPAKSSGNNIMSVAKEIQKAGETWKDAMERAKEVFKERRVQVVEKKKTEMDKLLALVRTKKELQGFANSDIERDAVRTAKVSGARFVTKEGFTSNQYKQNVPNKIGRKYWETRDRHADRLAPNYPKDMPLLASGGVLPDEYVRVVRWADGNYRVEKKTKQNDFGRSFNDVFEDVVKAESFAKKIAENNKLNYIGVGTMPYDFRKSNLPEKEFLEEYYKKNKFADGGSFAPNVFNGTQFMGDVYANGGEVKSVVDALFEFNEKRGKLNTSFGAKTKEGITALIENDNYSSEEIAKAIFYSNNKKEKISTGYGDKSFFGLQDMIERARGKEFANGGMADLTMQNVSFANGGATEKYKVGQKFYDTRYDRVSEIVPSSYDGVVTWKRYNKSGTEFENDSEHILVENQFDYLVNMGAYQISKQSMADGGSFAPNVSDGTSFMDNAYFANGGSVDYDTTYFKVKNGFVYPMDSFDLSQKIYGKHYHSLEPFSTEKNSIIDLNKEVQKQYEKLRNEYFKTLKEKEYVFVGIGQLSPTEEYVSKIEKTGDEIKIYEKRDDEDGSYLQDMSYDVVVPESFVFKVGSDVGDNVLGLNKGDVYKVIDKFHLSTDKTYTFIDYVDRYGEIVLKSLPFPTKPRKKDDFVYISQVSSEGIKILNPEEIGKIISVEYKNYIENNFADGGHLEVQDPKDLYSKLNQAEMNWSKDNGLEYEKMKNEIQENRKLYIKKLNEAEMNWGKDNGKEYERLMSMRDKFVNGGSFAPNVSNGTQFMGDVYADGGDLDEVAEIHVSGYPYFIKKMGDTTHFKMANSKDGVDVVMGSHIGQHRGEEYYEDIRSWLKGGKSPDGNKYDSKYYAKGGEVNFKAGQGEKYFDKKLQMGLTIGKETDFSPNVFNIVWEDGERSIYSKPNIEFFISKGIWKKTDKFANGGSVKKVPAYVKRRLEELRMEIREERISTGEIAELESLKQYIDPSDVELLQWAGVPEFEEDDDNYAKGGDLKSEFVDLTKPPVGYNLFTYFYSKDEKSGKIVWNIVGAYNDVENGKKVRKWLDRQSEQSGFVTLKDGTEIKISGRGSATESGLASDVELNKGIIRVWEEFKPKYWNNETSDDYAKGGSVKKVPAYAKRRLEELREEIREERISTGEIAELESLKQYIDPSDVELLQWAGVPEFEEDEDNYAKGGKLTKSEVMRNMYKPSGDYFFEQKGNDLIVHLTSKDAGNSITNLMDKYDVKDNGRGYHGSSYILSRKNKLNDGGALPFMTDPNFGDFQNTGSFANGGDIDEEYDDVFVKIYNKYNDKNYFGSKEQISTMLRNWQNALDKGDKNAEKYTKEDVIRFVKENNISDSYNGYLRLKKAIKNSDVKFLKSNIRYDQKFIKELYEELTGNKLPNTNKEIQNYFDSKYANGGALPFMTDTNFGDFQNTGSFANGGLLVNNSTDLEEVAKYMFTSVKKRSWDLKDLIHYFNEDNGFDYKNSVKVWDDMNGYEMRKTYDNILEMLKRIVEANNKKFELGGAFVMTDLAGHTGGSDGLGNPMPLDGFSGTHYTGLVGETGAMSSGELFAVGGAVGDNVLGLKKGDIYKVIDTQHTAGSNIYTFIDYVDKDDEIMLKSLPFPPNPKKKNDFEYIYEVSSDGIKILNDEEIGQVISKKYKNFVQNNYEAGGAMSSGELFENGGDLHSKELIQEQEKSLQKIKQLKIDADKKKEKLYGLLQLYVEGVLYADEFKNKFKGIFKNGGGFKFDYEDESYETYNYEDIKRIFNGQPSNANNRFYDKAEKCLKNKSLVVFAGYYDGNDYGYFEQGGAMMQNQQVINDASQSYVNYYLGQGASQGIYKDGGSIPNNYEGRTPEDVWNNWTIKQRYHFLSDHENRFPTFGNKLFELAKVEYNELPIEIYLELDSHVMRGQYAKGGAIKNQYEGRTPEDVWNKLTTKQREHFLHDHIYELNRFDLKGQKKFNLADIEEAESSDWLMLDFAIKQTFKTHIRMGQYAYGGKTKSRPSMREIYIEEIASLTGTRNNVGIQKFADENNLTDSELSNLTMGLGRGMISKGDFVTALVGNKNNPKQKEVIAFAKSNKAYKMADGGALKFKVGQGEKYFDKREKMQLTIGRESDIPNVYNVNWEDGENSIYSADNINFLISKGVWKKLDKMADGGDLGYFDGMSEEEILKSTVVFDNNGKSYDRYTVFTPDDSVFGMSEDAKGFNIYIGDKSEIPMGKHLGKKLTAVPQGIRMAVLNRMKEEYANGGSFAPNVSNGTEFMSGVYANGGGVKRDRYNGEKEKIVEALKKIKGGLDNKAPYVYVKDGLIYVSAEEDDNYADYYENLFIDKKLEDFADKYDTYWEWENAGAIVLFPLSDGDEYAKGGFVGTVEFNAGDVVWQKDEKGYATIMNNYGDPINGDYGDVRLDTTGNTSIYSHDPKRKTPATIANATGYNLIKVGEKGDTGKFTPEVLAEMKESANRLINYRKEAKDKEGVAYYQEVYKRLLDGEFDSMTGAKATASNKKGSKDYTYVPNKDVKELSVVLKGELKKLMGSDILDGVYVKNSAKSDKKADADAVFAKILKDAKEAKYDNGKTKMFTATDLKKLNLEMVQKLSEAGYTEQQIRNVIFGYAFDNEIVADNELEYDKGIFSYEDTYVKSKIEGLVEAQKKKEFAVGIEYPDFDWQGIIKKYKISSKPKDITEKQQGTSGSTENYYEVFVGDNIVIGHNYGYKWLDADGKVLSNYMEEDKKVSDPTKQNAWQKERGQKAGFNGGWWTIISSKIEIIDDVLKTLLAQKGSYCKEIQFYDDSLPKTLKENKIAFADGGMFDNNDGYNLKDINGKKIEVGDTVKTTQQSGGLFNPNDSETGIVEKTKDAFGQESLQIRYRKQGTNYDRFILLNGKINEIVDKSSSSFEQGGFMNDVYADGGGVDDGWELKREGVGFGSILHNGKKVDDYEWDSDAMTFWVSNPMGGQKSIDTQQELFNYYKAKGYADGGFMNDVYAKGGEISIYNLRKGDKVKTRKGDIETIIRRTGSGSYETIENDYTHSPESLEFVSRPSRKMADGGSMSEDVAECKKLVSAFCKEFGDKFGLNEEAILEKVKFRDYLGYGASVFVSLSITSNVTDLKVGETRPTGGYIIFTSDINPNGVTGKDDIARTYTIDIEIKGSKRYTQRRTEEGRYFKSYNYGRTIEEVMDKTDTKIIYDLYPLEKKDDLKFKMSHLFADGGSFAPSVSDGTAFMDNAYFANGGSTGSGLDPVKVKVVMAIGLDSAIEFYDADYPIRPYQLLERGVRGGYITLDEINERVVDSAMETAQDSKDMEEVGSSDFGAFMYNFLNEAGFKVGRVNGRLTREFADGGFMNDVYAKGGELADIQKMKKALISKAKSKGLYENFGEKEVRVLEDKYGYTDNVRDFNNWAMKFDLSRMADGGGVQDRKMKVGDKVYRYYTIYEPYKEVIDKSKIYTIVSIDEQEPSFKNAYAKKIIKTNDGVIHSENTVVKVDYVENRGFAEGGMFDNNDGFMKADNNRNFRYPEGEVRVDAIDEPIDLTDNVSYAYNEVTVMPLNDEIDLRESNNMRVGKPYVPKNRNPNKMMAVNPRMIITDFPTPNSNKHKND